MRYTPENIIWTNTRGHKFKIVWIIEYSVYINIWRMMQYVYVWYLIDYIYVMISIMNVFNVINIYILDTPRMYERIDNLSDWTCDLSFQEAEWKSPIFVKKKKKGGGLRMIWDTGTRMFRMPVLKIEQCGWVVVLYHNYLLYHLSCKSGFCWWNEPKV